MKIRKNIRSTKKTKEVEKIKATQTFLAKNLKSYKLM